MSTNVTSSAQTPETAGQTAAQQSETTRGRAVFRPLADIRESSEGVTVTVEMPGVGPDDVEIELERRVLTIRGRGRMTAPEGFRRVYAEYEEGDYERAFTVSDDLEAAKVKASMKNGVLTLELPRAQDAKPKQIKVSAA